MIIRPIQKADTKGGFCCGRPALDAFLQKRAWAHEESHVSRVYVLVDNDELGGAGATVVGFYTLAAKEVARERLRGPLPGSLPKYPLPVFYIGYFAVSEAHQGQGLGRRLMGDALRRCAEGADTIGAVGVFLDSLDDQSTAFYRRLGFVDVPREPSAAGDCPQPMFLSMKDLLAARPAGR